jgi:hypothetical protein
MRLSAVAFAVAFALAPSAATASMEAVATDVPVRLSPAGRILQGGELARVRLRTTCPSGWEPLEAFAYLTQDGNTSQFGSFTPVCDGLARTYTVDVAAMDVAFHPGESTGTAYVLLMGPNGQTRSGGDTRTVTLS